MFDIGWTELLLIGIVALIVVGPKDLPVMFHTLGRFTAKAKAMAREFQSAMNEAARDSGMSDVGKDLKSMTSAKGLGLDRLKEAATKFEKWDPAKPTTPKGPATAALSEERAAAAKKISEAAAQKATERKAKEAEAAAATPVKAAGAAADPTSATKPAVKKIAKKVVTKTVAKPATEKTATEKPATKKPAKAKAPRAGKPAGTDTA